MEDFAPDAQQFLKQCALAELSIAEARARMIAKARQCGVEAVVVDDEMILKGRSADEVLAEGREVLDV